MPTTVNGIGTHYYGKRNLSTRTAPCHSCGRVGALQSYDTRLWFVVIFIPVIPLGRKRIIDLCPSCQRHMVADAAKYEQARQLQTSGSLERFRREGTPESALTAHAQLLAFHEHEQAAELRAQALEKFPEDAQLRASLADHMRHVSSFEEMAKLHEEALALDPDLPDARVGVATWKMAHGELDEARTLLDVLEEPGAGHQYNLAPLYSLAQAYGKAGRHEEALELSRVLLREAPDLGNDHDFRALVAKAERSAGTADSILPARKHSLRGLFFSEGSPYSKGQRTLAILAAAIALAALGLTISNEYIRRHRTIRVVNATGAPIQVKFDDGPAVTVDEMGALPASEGHHRVQITGAVQDSREVDLSSGYLQRWTSSPLWVLNPGGEAVLQEITLHYAKNPRPSENRVIIGDPFVGFPHVDYAFREPPNQINVDSRTSEVTKVVVKRIEGHDLSAFESILQTDRARALDFAERRLKSHPQDDNLLNGYLRALGAAERPRAEALLRSGLERRPVDVRWHRAYQGLMEHSGGVDRMISEYDAMLAKEPTSAALLYLRGRIDPSDERREDFFRRSSEADPNFPWPIMAAGLKAMNEGKWNDALRDLEKARSLGLSDPQIAMAVHVARLGLGQAAQMVTDYRNRLASQPTDVAASTFLFDAMAAAGQADQIEAARASWEMRLPEQVRPIVGGIGRAFSFYQAGKPDLAASAARSIPFAGVPLVLAQALAAFPGHAKEAADDPVIQKLEDDWTIGAVALGLMLDGKKDEADAWRKKLIQTLQAGGQEDRSAAKLVEAEKPPTQEEIDRVFLRPGEKALLYTLLAERFPEKKAEYHDEARKFNVSRLPPYLVVARALEGDPKPEGK